MNNAEKSKAETAEQGFSGVRVECPLCGSSDGFAPIIGYEETLEVGYCHSCAEWINKVGAEFTRKQQEKKPFKEINFSEVQQTGTCLRDNPLFEHFSRLIPEDELYELFRKWRVGYDGRFTHFWQIDQKGIVRNCKLIKYQNNGHRNKKYYPRPKYKGFRQILFGLHLLEPGKIVNLVESEKTAIIMSYFYPQFCWIASGGATSLTKDKANALRGHKVYYWEDRDVAGRKSGQKVEQVLNSVGAFCELKSLEFDGEGDGSDILDWCIDPKYWEAAEQEKFKTEMARAEAKNDKLDFFDDEFDPNPEYGIIKNILKERRSNE